MLGIVGPSGCCYPRVEESRLASAISQAVLPYGHAKDNYSSDECAHCADGCDPIWKCSLVNDERERVRAHDSLFGIDQSGRQSLVAFGTASVEGRDCPLNFYL